MIPSPRPDDRLLVGAPLTVDLGQYEEDLTASGAAVYEDPSARAAVAGAARAVELELSIGSLSAGAIFAVGREVPGEGYEVTVVGGVLSASVNGAVVATITPSNLVAVPSGYVVAWCSETNSEATVPGDAIRSELTAYDIDAQQLVRAEATHEAAIVDEAHGLAVGGAWNGLVIVDAYTDTIDGARLAASFHARPMIREHWIAETPAPSVDSLIAIEGQVLPSAVSLSPAAAGPQYAAAAQAMQAGRNRHRLASPLVQLMQRASPDLEGNPALGQVLADTLGAKRVLVFGDVQAPLGWVFRRRVPRACNYVRVSVQWATWVPGAGAVDEVTLYAYASQGPPANPVELQRRQITRAVEDGPNRFGVRETFELLPVPRDGDGLTYLWLAAEVAGANVEWTLREISIVPVTVSPGFDEGDLPGGWGP